MLPRRPVPARPVPAPDRHAAIAPLSIQVTDDLGAQLRSLALAEGQSPEALGQHLLARALEQEVRRARTERTLARLTARQQEVAWLAADGGTNRQIAEALVISTETVKTHIANVLERLGLRSKAELRLLLLELGWPPKVGRQSTPGSPTAFRRISPASPRAPVRLALATSDSESRSIGEASAVR